MAGITQKVPNYILGISEQPDELKSPGQVSDLKNGIPDVTHGLVKRPGGKLVSAITPTSGTLSWFHIYEDSDNQYIGNVSTTGVVQIWRTSDGAVIPVDYASVPGTNLCTYLTGWSDSTDIQSLTINQNTFLTNRTKTVSMLTGTSDKSPAEVHEAIIELKSVSYGKQYAFDIYEPSSTATTTTKRATSISIDEDITTSNASGYSNDGKCELMSREVINQGTVSGKTNLRYEVDIRCTPIAEGGGSTSNHPNYDDSYQTFARLQFGGEGWDTGDTHDYVTAKGAGGTITIESHASITSRANLAAVRPPATPSNSEEAATAGAILGDMKVALDAISGTGITSTIVGNCLHLTSSTAFNVTTTEKALMGITTSEANSAGELPRSGRHNYVVKVVNSAEEEDDYYLKFQVDNVSASASGTFFGNGVWIECPAPGIEISLNTDTMPVSLVRVDPGTYAINGGTSQSYSNGVFELTKPTWIDRTVGDDITNPEPSFVDYKINKLLYFRNRLAILSEENVILSQTNDFFNFWSTTAMAVSGDDPIDLQASSTYPTTLYDAIEVNSGLLIHSSNQQFMLTTDSDALTPSTAKINYLSSYNFNHKTNPFSLGVTNGFLNSTGKNARFFEMSNVGREGEPTVIEQSKIVSKKLPIEITTTTVSRENSVILFGALDKSELWGYRYYNTGEKRIQSAWFRWELPGTLTYHVILDDVYYAVLKNGSNYTLQALDVKKQDDTTSIDTYRIHLDCHSTVSSLASNTYNSTTKKTVFPKPTGYDSTKQLAVYNNNAGNDLGRYGLVTVNGSNLEVDGDWTGADLILGYVFDWLVEIPTIFASKTAGNKSVSDTRASLVVHRINFTFGETGTIETTLKRKGRADYSDTFESVEWSNYTSNSLPIASEYIHTIPAYERNTNLTVQLKASHPSPATLHSMNWEGDYNTKFYRSA
tara:strand:+ start:2441 stop:5248 length:2808 start_codon:yes stop_codon:yes gene_type:complete